MGSQEQENKEENQEETKEENQEETKEENQENQEENQVEEKKYPDDAQWLMNIAKRDVVLKTLLAATNNTTTFEELFKVADENHCDVLTAALLSLKRKKII